MPNLIVLMKIGKKMSRLVYFVVGVDLDDKEIYIDDETFMAVFSKSQQVWDTDLNEWREYEADEYERAVDLLNTRPLGGE